MIVCRVANLKGLKEKMELGFDDICVDNTAKIGAQGCQFLVRILKEMPFSLRKIQYASLLFLYLV